MIYTPKLNQQEQVVLIQVIKTRRSRMNLTLDWAHTANLLNDFKNFLMSCSWTKICDVLVYFGKGNWLNGGLIHEWNVLSYYIIRWKLLYRRLSLISFNARYAQRKSFFAREGQFFFTFFTFFFCFQYFTGNRDQNTVVQYRLFPRVIARYIRVHPWGWYKHISMRVDFYGCPQGNVYSVLKTAA